MSAKKTTEKASAKAQANKQQEADAKATQKKEELKKRTKQFAGSAALTDSTFGVLKGMAKKDADALNQTECTALALTLIPPGGAVEWKSLVKEYNRRKLAGVPAASEFSDGRGEGFNMRNILWKAEHKEKFPLRVLRGDKLMNTKVHSNDGILRGKLQGFTLLPTTFEMLKKESALVKELHQKFLSK